VDESGSVELAYRRKKYIFDTPATPAEAPQLLSEQLLPRPARHNSHNAVQLLRAGRAAFEVRVFWPLRSEVDRNRSMMCYLLADEERQPNSLLQMMGDFLPYLPSRMGHNPALDRGVACICSLYRGFVDGGQRPAHAAQIREYLHAVSAVRDCIADPAQRLSSETICATIILQVCEVRSHSRRAVECGLPFAMHEWTLGLVCV
jgi:hypothetical protein